MKIIPVNNFMLRNTPNANLRIQGTTDEVSIINRVKMDAGYCVNVSQQIYEKTVEQSSNDTTTSQQPKPRKKGKVQRGRTSDDNNSP
jgi:hypothetical protein